MLNLRSTNGQPSLSYLCTLHALGVKFFSGFTTVRKDKHDFREACRVLNQMLALPNTCALEMLKRDRAQSKVPVGHFHTSAAAMGQMQAEASAPRCWQKLPVGRAQPALDTAQTCRPRLFWCRLGLPP